MRLLLPFFLVIPIIEMYVLITVGGVIGALPTIGLVALTAFIGVWLLRLEGTATWLRIQQELAAGQVPQQSLLEGAMLLIGGALLLTPGFVTDAIGFTCLIPMFRRPLANMMLARLAVVGVASATRFRQGPGHVIDGEFQEHPDNPAANRINDHD